MACYIALKGNVGGIMTNNQLDFAPACGRRRWIVGSALAAGGVLFEARGAMAAAGDNEISHTAEAIHQELAFKAEPNRIYETLLDARQFQRVELLSDAKENLDVAGKPARIERRPGGAFSLFGDHIVGMQIELLENQRIVQAWRVVNWDPGVYSIAKFELSAQGSGTKLVFDHTGFPAGAAEHLVEGWKSHYWEPLQKFLG
jgi:activator of HSP90 ATPase